jgi:hypothetical protein
VLSKKFDDAEESFHVDKDVTGQEYDGRQVEVYQQQQPQAQVSTAESTDVADAPIPSSSQTESRMASSVRLVAAPSPSPRIDHHHHHQPEKHQHQLLQQQQQQQQLPPHISHVLSSLDSAEAALAQALQGLFIASLQFFSRFYCVGFLHLPINTRCFEFSSFYLERYIFFKKLSACKFINSNVST